MSLFDFLRVLFDGFFGFYQCSTILERERERETVSMVIYRGSFFDRTDSIDSLFFSLLFCSWSFLALSSTWSFSDLATFFTTLAYSASRDYQNDNIWVPCHRYILMWWYPPTYGVLFDLFLVCVLASSDFLFDVSMLFFVSLELFLEFILIEEVKVRYGFSPFLHKDQSVLSYHRLASHLHIDVCFVAIDLVEFILPLGQFVFVFQIVFSLQFLILKNSKERCGLEW
jgi:hypothetical protein